MPSPNSNSAKPRLSTADSWSPSLSKQMSEHNSQNKGAIKIKYSVKQPELMTVRRTDGGSILRVKKTPQGLFQPNQTTESKPTPTLSSSREGKLPSRAQDQPFSVIMGNRAYRRAPDLRVQPNKTLDSIHEDSRSQEQMHSSRHASVSVEYRPSSREGQQSSRNRLPTKSYEHSRLFSRTVDHDAPPFTQKFLVIGLIEPRQKYTRLPQVLGKQSGDSPGDSSPENGMNAAKLPENNLVGPLHDLQETDIPAIPFFSLKIRIESCDEYVNFIRKNNCGLSRSARSARTTKALELGDSMALLRSTKAFSVHDEATQTEAAPVSPLATKGEDSSERRVQKEVWEQNITKPIAFGGSQSGDIGTSVLGVTSNPKNQVSPEVPQLDLGNRRALATSLEGADPKITEKPAENRTNTWPLWEGSSSLQRLVRLFADTLSCETGEDPAIQLCSAPLMCFYVLEGMPSAAVGNKEIQDMLQTEGVCGVFQVENKYLQAWEASQDPPHPVTIDLEPQVAKILQNSSETQMLEVDYWIFAFLIII